MINEKEFRILSLILSNDKLLTTTEIAKKTGYPRKTLEPYINQFAEFGFLLDSSNKNRIHGWKINKDYVTEIIKELKSFAASVEYEITTIIEKRRQIWAHLIDVDSTIPNLALMKISSYHKARGDRATFSKGVTVGFASNKAPDKIYVSTVFKRNKDKVTQLISDLSFTYPNTEIDVGGSGYDLKKTLPDEIEELRPDYTLYSKCDYSMGFSSRGCVRTTKTCPFCIVPIKEGKFRRVAHPEAWHNPEFKNIVFLDNNILSDKDWFMQVTAWCIQKSLKIWFTQGLDIRKMDEDIAKRLLEMKKYKSIYFAWDHIEDEAIIREKIALLRSVGFTDKLLERNIAFYVYVDSDAEFDSGVYRCRELKKLGVASFAMYNIDNKITHRITHFRRWTRSRNVYWSCDVEEYIEANKRSPYIKSNTEAIQSIT